ncbi:MAG: hypothetical protein ACRET0_16605 [Steroidobacteraceae bacterium]
MLRAFDRKIGEQIGGVLMSAQQSGTPMIHMIAGMQHIIVALSRDEHPGG